MHFNVGSFIGPKVFNHVFITYSLSHFYSSLSNFLWDFLDEKIRKISQLSKIMLLPL